MAVRFLHYSDLENVYDEPDRVGRLAGRIKQLRDPETLVVGTGDNTAPGVLSMVSEGRQSLDFFAAVEPDFDTFGNHDFDYGLDATRHIVRLSPQTWVSANVRQDGEVFGADLGVVPSVVSSADGTRVGITGVTDPKTDSMCPGAVGLTFTDPIEAVTRETSRLREQGVDTVVVLSHLGCDDDMLSRQTDVDVVLGGHVHTQRVDHIADTLLTRPGAGGHHLFEIDIAADTVTRHDVAEGPLEASVANELRERWTAMGLNETVAHVPEPIRRDLSLTTQGECRIGNFIADAYRWAANADAGLQNTGGIRDGPPLSGPVTVAELISVVPFDEPLVVAEVTGAELLACCQQADEQTLSSANANANTSDKWHAHVSGLRIRQDEHGEITANIKGDTIDQEDTYTIATPDYVLHTEHEFPVLDEKHRVTTVDTQYKMLAAYAREHGIEPELDDRIERVDDDQSPAQ